MRDNQSMVNGPKTEEDGLNQRRGKEHKLIE